MKLFRNTFLACKVAFCNEIYEFCKKNDINYSRMVNLACNDERIGQSHNKVPGHDGRKGFGGLVGTVVGGAVGLANPAIGFATGANVGGSIGGYF